MSETKRFISPKGELEWVTISGEGKENLSGKMQYVANVVIEADDPIIKEIEEFWEANKPAGFKKDAKSLGIYPHKADTGEKDEDGKAIYEEDGKSYLAFKTGVTFADGKQKVVKVYNAKGKQVSLPDSVGIGNGSIGAIGGAIGIYTTTGPKGNILDAGVTLYLNSVKIYKLEEFTGQEDFAEDPDAEGWTGEDDSFEGEALDSDESKAKPRL